MLEGLAEMIWLYYGMFQRFSTRAVYNRWMDTTVLNAAVVGAGIMGSNHARAYTEHPATELVAVIDIDQETAEDAAQTYGASETYDSVTDAVTDESIDIVSIATPETHHLEPTQRALNAEVNVLLEKPIANDEETARRIGSLAESADTELMIGYLCRFDPRYHAVRKSIKHGEMGEVLGIQAARIASATVYDQVADWTSPLYYLSVHDLDIMRWYLDQEVVQVYAEASDGLYGSRTPAVVHATLRFSDGTIGLLETSWARPDSYPATLTEEIRVTGTEGYNRIEIENDDVRISTIDGYRYGDTLEINGKLTANVVREIDHFVDCVRSGQEPKITWRDGLQSLRAANAIHKSLENEAPIQIDH